MLCCNASWVSGKFLPLIHHLVARERLEPNLFDLSYKPITMVDIERTTAEEGQPIAYSTDLCYTTSLPDSRVQNLIWLKTSQKQSRYVLESQTVGLQNGSVGYGACHQVRWSEVNAQCSHGGRRNLCDGEREITAARCSVFFLPLLLSAHILC